MSLPKSASGRVGIFLDLHDSSVLHNPLKVREVLSRFARQLHHGAMVNELGRVDVAFSVRHPGARSFEPVPKGGEPPTFVTHFVAASTVRLPNSIEGYLFEFGTEVWVAASLGARNSTEVASRLEILPPEHAVLVSLTFCSEARVREIRSDYLAPRRM